MISQAVSLAHLTSRRQARDARAAVSERVDDYRISSGPATGKLVYLPAEILRRSVHMRDTTTTSSPPAPDGQRLLIGLCNALALGTLFWTCSWWLLS